LGEYEDCTDKMTASHSLNVHPAFKAFPYTHIRMKKVSPDAFADGAEGVGLRPLRVTPS